MIPIDLAAPDHTPKVLLPMRAVLVRYSICSRTLDRWIASARLGFPTPIVINRRRYFQLGELVAWERARASQHGTLEAA